MMWYEEDSNEDKQQNKDRMAGVITEKNPNENEKQKCNCTKGCSKRFCSCFKFGKGCNSSCGCNTSCQNMFNHLDYFFGENEKKYSANPCFSKWLVENAKNENELYMIDRNDLYQCIIQCSSIQMSIWINDLLNGEKNWIKSMKKKN